VNLVLTDAVKRGASDIHIEPTKKSSVSASVLTACCKRSCRRPSSSRRNYFTPQNHGEAGYQRKALAAGWPIMLKMNIGGRKKQLDFRVSTLPRCGEKKSCCAYSIKKTCAST